MDHISRNFWFLDVVLIPLLMTLTLLFFTNLMANLRFKREANAKIYHVLQRLGTSITRLGRIENSEEDYETKLEVLRNTIEDFHGAVIKRDYRPSDPFTMGFYSIEQTASLVRKGQGKYILTPAGVNTWAMELVDKHFKVERLPLWKLVFTPR